MGSLDVGVAREFSAAIDDLNRNACIDRFLFDVRDARNVSDEIDNYNFASRDLADIELQVNARSAILASPTDTSHHFVEQALRRAGYRARIFDNAAAAVAWLDAPTP
jgi:nitric oxide synthase oxygenase domain/subunit